MTENPVSRIAEPLVLKAATPRINNIFGSDDDWELQNVLEKISQQYVFDKLSRILAAAKGCYNMTA